MNVLRHKGFAARIDFDPDDLIFVGRIAGIRDVVTFHADNGAALVAAFHEAVDDYIDACAAAGKPPDKPFKGDISLRIDPEIHQKAALAAELMGKSLNKWAEEVLKSAAEKTEAA